MKTPIPQKCNPTQGKQNFEQGYVKTVMVKYWNVSSWLTYGARMNMWGEINTETREWQNHEIEYVLQLTQPRRDCYDQSNRWAGAYVCWTDLSWEDDDLDVETEFKVRKAKSDAVSLTALTGTLDIADPGLKVGTMLNRQRI